jgi:hypothetical protein
MLTKILFVVYIDSSTTSDMPPSDAAGTLLRLTGQIGEKVVSVQVHLEILFAGFVAFFHAACTVTASCLERPKVFDPGE